VDELDTYARAAARLADRYEGRAPFNPARSFDYLLHTLRSKDPTGLAAQRFELIASARERLTEFVPTLIEALATTESADAAFAAPYLAMMNRIGRERGWPPAGRPQYEALRAPDGALAVGAPEQLAEKILYEHELFDHQRYIAQMSVGAVAHRDVMHSIELFGSEVAPLVRSETARRAANAGDASGAAATTT